LVAKVGSHALILCSAAEDRKEGVLLGRLLVLAATIVLAVLSLASVAGAEQPVREFVPASDFTVSGSCAFDVAVHIVGNKEYGITFSNGATLVTGSLKLTLTNVSDPTKSITLNILGPGLNTVSRDGTFTIDARGPWLFFYPGVLLYTTGYNTFTVSPSGEVTLQQRGRTSRDLCSVPA
jgi:hypothetical protein